MFQGKVFKEFFRYIFVGGSAFLIDIGALYMLNEFVFVGKYLFLSVALAYLIGMTYNFILSCFWVFDNGKEKFKNELLKSYWITFVVSAVGLGLTEILMKLCVDVIGLYYMYSKILVSGIVLFWNFYGRKKLLYK